MDVGKEIFLQYLQDMDAEEMVQASKVVMKPSEFFTIEPYAIAHAEHCMCDNCRKTLNIIKGHLDQIFYIIVTNGEDSPKEAYYSLEIIFNKWKLSIHPLIDENMNYLQNNFPLTFSILSRLESMCENFKELAGV